MRAALLLLALGLAAVAAVARNPQRIVGGSVTSIEQYPYGASLMYSWNLLTYHQSCGGAIINARAILSAAHCFVGDTPPRWRVRVGSTMANSGGVVHHLSNIIIHPQYGSQYSSIDNDVAILHLASVITFNNQAQPASIASPSYNLPDNESVWAIGWGTTSPGGVQSEQLRHVEVWTVNQALCRIRYAELGWVVTNQMLCSGWLDIGGRDQCQGDSGGPLIHNNVIVGVCSWGQSCALARYPGVNARVSRFTNWIQANS